MSKMRVKDIFPQQSTFWGTSAYLKLELLSLSIQLTILALLKISEPPQEKKWQCFFFIECEFDDTGRWSFKYLSSYWMYKT